MTAPLTLTPIDLALAAILLLINAGGLWMLSQGAEGLRVHDVGATRRAMAVWQAIEKTQ